MYILWFLYCLRTIKHPKIIDFRVLVADRVGFEPTCRNYRQTDFESARLCPVAVPEFLITAVKISTVATPYCSLYRPPDVLTNVPHFDTCVCICNALYLGTRTRILIMDRKYFHHRCGGLREIIR